MVIFQKADPAQVLRAASKDDSYVDQLRRQVADCVQDILGNHNFVRITAVTDSLAALVYYCLTTLSDNQTLGEEYVGLIQVDKTLRFLPSKLARASAVVLQVLGPQFFSQITSKLDSQLSNSENWTELKYEVRQLALVLVQAVNISSSFITRLNLVAFYMFGKFYRLSQRVTSIHMISTAAPSGSASPNRTFQAIGLIAFLHSLLLIAIKTADCLKNRKSHLLQGIKTDSVDAVDPTAKCTLCWDSRQNPSCTPCGHLFCWSCILQWLQAKNECPVCREIVQPSRVVPLFNYR